MDLARILSGQAGRHGVWSVLYGDGRAALHDALRSMIGSQATMRACRLRRATFKPRRKLIGYYDIVLEGVAQPVLTAVTWFPDGVSANPTQLAAAEESLRGAGTSTRFDRLWAIDASQGMLVLAAPLDAAIPSLAALSDAGSVPGVLASCGGRHSANGDEHAVVHLRYRPGRKHVLEYRSPRGKDAFVKLYRADAADHFVRAATAFADLVDAAGLPGVQATLPAAVLHESGAILYRPVPGTPLSRWMRLDQPGVAAHLQRVGALLRAIHSSDRTAELRVREPEGEVAAVFRACEAITVIRPELGAAALAVAERARDRLAELEQETATPVHGDVKADHVLCTADGITLLDTDRCAVTDPALDLGKLLADLRWWSSAGSGFDVGAAESALLAGYGFAPPRWARARMYSALLLVKMASRRVPVASRGWASRTAALIELARREMDGSAA